MTEYASDPPLEAVFVGQGRLARAPLFFISAAVAAEG